MTENLFSHAADATARTTETSTADDASEPVTMPVFSHLGK